MEILEKLMDNALNFKHTRKIIFEFIDYEDENQKKQLIFNCRKTEIKEISMWDISDSYKKERYFLTEKMITQDIIDSFLHYSSYEKECLFLNKAYYIDTNGNSTEIYNDSILEAA